MNKVGKVFIIDDDEANNLICTININKAQIATEIKTFKSAREGLKVINQATNDQELPDVIFLDINMPVMSGWDFLDSFKNVATNVTKKITLFMLSSSVMEEDVNKARSYIEVTDYITKPLSIEKLKMIQERYF
jgi:CheY-like chemotaxis protein